MHQAGNGPKKYLPSLTMSFLAVTFICGLFLSPTVQAKEKENIEKNIKKVKIYDPALNVKAAITAAIIQAKKENKHIILMFGGNWCPWCHRLHQLITSHSTINQFLASHYLLIMVDVGETPKEPLNRDLVAQFGIIKMGYPSLVVLDSEGNQLCSQSSGVLEKGKGHDPEKVLAFLKAEAPNKK